MGRDHFTEPWRAVARSSMHSTLGRKPLDETIPHETTESKTFERVWIYFKEEIVKEEIVIVFRDLQFKQA